MSTNKLNDSSSEVAVLGAGPYGLAVAAHLRGAKVETRVFGRTMEFWDSQMPEGMLLRSSWEASHISDPERALTLDRYQGARGVQLKKPIPLENFVEYGRWFQERSIPDLDRRRIVRVEKSSRDFLLTLEDGETIHARRVIVAVGIASFTLRPAIFDGLPRELVSHTSEHRNLGYLSGKKVAIVGGGQSALESAALLAEAGAEVEVIVRRSTINWLDQKMRWLKSDSNPLKPVFYPPTDVGPPGLNWIVALPDLFRLLPLNWQDKVAYRSIRPAGAGWLKPRIEKVRLTVGRVIGCATPEGDKITLELDDQTKRTVDHVLLATGYRVNVGKHSFLDEKLRDSMHLEEGYPILRRGFESNVPGLHFAGAPAARSYGPICRFVCGTHYTAREMAKHIAGPRRAAWNLF